MPLVEGVASKTPRAEAGQFDLVGEILVQLGGQALGVLLAEDHFRASCASSTVVSGCSL